MSIIQTADDLLRNRDALYQTARQGTGRTNLCGRLLVIFVLTTGLYGAVMGAYRFIHPDFYFSDALITTQGHTLPAMKVAGVSVKDRAIYVYNRNLSAIAGDTVRFNASKPTEAFTIAAVQEEKGYSKIILNDGVPLRETDAWKLPLLVALKIPLLFVLTLLVCSLALYIINLACGIGLRFMPVMTVFLLALAGTGVLLLAFGPISLLFAVVTTNYHFMKLMHVVMFVVAGLFGVKVLAEALPRIRPSQDETVGSPVMPRRTGRLFLAWLLLYCLVGAQLAWTLKPFLGTPYLPETPPFRVDKGNIFVSVLGSSRAIGPRQNDGSN